MKIFVTNHAACSEDAVVVATGLDPRMKNHLGRYGLEQEYFASQIKQEWSTNYEQRYINKLHDNEQDVNSNKPLKIIQQVHELHMAEETVNY
jgi:hypothetical protein